MPIIQTKKIVQFLAVAALAVSMLDNGVSGTGSVLSQTGPDDAAKVEETIPHYTVLEAPAEEAPRESELKSSSCECNKDETGKPEAHLAREDKDSASGKAKKSSGNKFRVITISIPVDPESIESVKASVVDEKKGETGCRGKKLESAESTPIAVDVKESEEIRENVVPATSVEPENGKIAPEEEEEEAEEVVEVPKSKKQLTPKQTKSEKKRSKRSTKGKSHKNKERFTKVKGEKKAKNKK